MDQSPCTQPAYALEPPASSYYFLFWEVGSRIARGFDLGVCGRKCGESCESDVEGMSVRAIGIFIYRGCFVWLLFFCVPAVIPGLRRLYRGDHPYIDGMTCMDFETLVCEFGCTLFPRAFCLWRRWSDKFQHRCTCVANIVGVVGVAVHIPHARYRVVIARPLDIPGLIDLDLK